MFCRIEWQEISEKEPCIWEKGRARPDDLKMGCWGCLRYHQAPEDLKRGKWSLEKGSKGRKRDESEGKRTGSGESLPSALRYWEGWSINRRGEKGLLIPSPCLLRFDCAAGDTVRERDTVLHAKRIEEGDVDYICSLIEESADNLTDKDLRTGLVEWLRKWSAWARMGDETAQTNLRCVFRALMGELRGKGSPENLKAIISQYIDFFRFVIQEKQNSKKSLDKVFEDFMTKRVFYFSHERAWQIYRAHNAVATKCGSIGMDWDAILAFLEACKDNVDRPICQVRYKDYLFCKTRKHYTGLFGEVESEQLSW